MRVFIFIFLVALAITAISTPFLRRFAVWSGFIDTPEDRKVHKEPTPLLGGLAIVGGAVLAFLILWAALPTSIRAPEVIGVLLASMVVAITGLIDDRFDLPAYVKFSGQVVGFLIVVLFGIQVRLPVPEWLNYMLTFVWLIGITNAVNFMDNMDGLSAGVSGVAASFILLLAVQNDQYLVAAMSAAILGACLGFLRYNFKPARIFMGDAGALFLGFLLAILCIQLRFPENSNFVTWMVPVFIMGLPIFDTTLVIFSRLRRRVNPLTTAGKDHLSHRLVRRGFSEMEAVLILYLLGGAFGMAGLFITGASINEGLVLGATAAVLGLFAIWRLERRREIQDREDGPENGD